MPIGGGRKICAHNEWPYSAARRCLPLGQQRAVAARTTTALAAASSTHRRGAARGTPTPCILGTTDKVVSLDPAGAYDLGSQQLIGNMYQNLLAIPAGGNKPEPDAAESCEFTDPKTYVCKLKPDLKFSSGDPLTSEDVKFSLDRQLKIADPSGPSSLLGSLDSVEATDPTTVTMKLKKADGTWPFILTHNVAAIVPDEIYPADAKQPDDKAIGSGPYKLDKYTPEPAGRVHGQPELQRPEQGARRRTSSSSTSSRPLR